MNDWVVDILCTEIVNYRRKKMLRTHDFFILMYVRELK
jgi:hypothetical protein